MRIRSLPEKGEVVPLRVPLAAKGIEPVIIMFFAATYFIRWKLTTMKIVMAEYMSELLAAFKTQDPCKFVSISLRTTPFNQFLT